MFSKLHRYRLALATLGLAALSATTLGPAAAWAAGPNKVLIKDFMFMPMSLTVKIGATVIWVNMDDEPHNVVNDAGLFRSSALDTNESFSYTFEKPGTYRILCSIHPRMMATIVVE